MFSLRPALGSRRRPLGGSRGTSRPPEEGVSEDRLRSSGSAGH